MRKRRKRRIFIIWLVTVIILLAVLGILLNRNANRKVQITEYEDQSGSQGMFTRSRFQTEV